MWHAKRDIMCAWPPALTHHSLAPEYLCLPLTPWLVPPTSVAAAPQELVLDRNRIRVIDPDSFLELPRLRELRLEENGLRSLAHLHHLTGLQVRGASCC